MLPPCYHCCHCSDAACALPLPLCQCPYHAATAVAALPPLLTCCRCCHRSTAAAAAALPPRCLPPPPPTPSLHCHRRPRAANVVTALPTIAAPPPHCVPRTADASTALPTSPRFCRHCHAATTTTSLPPPLLPPSRPASPLLTASELPPPPSLPPLCCHRRPRAGNASVALPTIVAPLPRCLRYSTNTATALSPLTPRCRCRLHAACFCRAAAVLLLPTLPLRCQCCHHATDAAAVLLLPPCCCRRHRSAAACRPTARCC
jgi:hypothetical protein